MDRAGHGTQPIGARRLAAAACVAIAAAVTWRLANPTEARFMLAPAAIEHVAGFQYYAALPPTSPVAQILNDTSEAPRRSTLGLSAGDRALGPAHSLHEAIKTEGKGAFSHWGEGIHFSTPDNSDPRRSSTAYTVTATTPPTAFARSVTLGATTASLWLALVCLRLDWMTSAKLIALGWVLVLAPMAWIPDITGRLTELQLAGRTPLLLSYLAVVALGIAALMVAPFLSSWPLRATTSVVLLAGFLLDHALQVISGQHLQPDLVPVFISEREMAKTVVPTYLPAVLPTLAAGAAILAAFLLPARRWARSRRATAVPLVAWLGAVGLSVASPGHGLHVPSQVGVPAMVAVSLLPRSRAPAERAEVAYARAIAPMIRHIVVVIDESVRGDVMGINDDRYGNTPFLRSLGNALVNFGVATSATNCSVASRVIMRMGLRRDQLPDVAGLARRLPTPWQYAQRAGFGTSLLDGWARMHSYMDEAEFAQIGDFEFVDGEDYARDQRLPAMIAERLAGPQPTFVYVNKLGIHPRYALKVPPGVTETPAFLPPSVPLDERRAADVGDYHRALRHSVDAFFARLWPLLDDDTVVIYTSDHGQSLYEGGYDLSHCSLTATAHRGEVRVPLFALTKNLPLREQLHSAAAVLQNRADHYALFPTMLELMGYAPDWVRHEYGPSLFSATPAAEPGFLLGTYNQPGAYWLPLEPAPQ